MNVCQEEVQNQINNRLKRSVLSIHSTISLPIEHVTHFILDSYGLCQIHFSNYGITVKLVFKGHPGD